MRLCLTTSGSEWGQFYDERFAFGRILDNLGLHAPLLGPVLDARPQNVIEVGVGSGSMSALLSRFVPRVVGIDNDKTVLAKAREVNGTMQGSADFREADAFALAKEFPAGSFDFALSQGLLEHFSDEEIRALVREQVAIAQTVLVSVPSYWYPQQDFGNERLMKPADWERILAPLGFHVKVEPYGYGRHRKNLFLWRPFHLLISVRAHTQQASGARTVPK